MSESRLIFNLGRNQIKENYLTSAVVSVIDELIHGREAGLSYRDRRAGLNILNLIARTDKDPDFGKDIRTTLRIQEPTESRKKPDATIYSRLPDGSKRVVFLEVKDRARVRPGQLVDYRRSLDKKKAEYKRLMLLGWLHTQIEEADENAADARIYWHELSDRIRRSESVRQSKIGRYLVRSLLQFMEQEKGMVLKNVNGDYAGAYGKQRPLDDLANLFVVISNSLEKAGFKNRKLASEAGKTPAFGFYTSYKGTRFWAGVYTEHPHMVTLSLDEPPYPDEELDLELNKIFQLGATAQVKSLATFLKASADKLLKRAPKSQARKRKK